MEFLRGGKLRRQCPEAGRTVYGDVGSHHASRHWLPVDVQVLAKFKARDQFANNALANARVAAVDCHRQLDFIVPAAGRGSVFGDFYAAQCRINERVSAVALLVGVMEEFCRHHTVFIRNVNAGEGDAVEEGIVFRNLGIEDVVAPYYLGLDV